MKTVNKRTATRTGSKSKNNKGRSYICSQVLLKNRRAPGLDHIPTEIVKLIEKDQMSVLKDFFHSIYKSGIIPGVAVIYLPYASKEERL